MKENLKVSEDNFMFNYDRIIEAVYDDNSISHVLMVENSTDLGNSDTDFDVDLTSALWFNTEFEVIKVLRSTPVCSLEDVYKYCKENKVPIISEQMNEEHMVVGGSKDFIISKSLKGDWHENLNPSGEENKIKTLNDIYKLKGTIKDVNQAIADYFNSQEELDINLEIGVVENFISEDGDFEELLLHLNANIVKYTQHTIIISDADNKYLIHYINMPNRFNVNYGVESFIDFNDMIKIPN